MSDPEEQKVSVRCTSESPLAALLHEANRAYRPVDLCGVQFLVLATSTFGVTGGRLDCEFGLLPAPPEAAASNGNDWRPPGSSDQRKADYAEALRLWQTNALDLEHKPKAAAFGLTEAEAEAIEARAE